MIIYYVLFLLFLLIHGAPTEDNSNCWQYHQNIRLKTAQELQQQDNLNSPVILASIPGSGNTWVRLLLERATGILTGSIYIDPTLKHILRGEGIFNASTIVVKSHPGKMNVSTTSREVLLFKGIHHLSQSIISKKVIILVRDPFAAIMAETKRQLTKDQSHSTDIVLNEGNKAKWIEIILLQAFRSKGGTLKFLDILSTFARKNVMILRYEDLIDDKKREIALLDVLKFLGPTYVSNKERISCAFASSDLPTIHRNSSSSLNTIIGGNPHLVCDLWKRGVETFAQAFNYSIMNNIQCTDLRPALGQ